MSDRWMRLLEQRVDELAARVRRLEDRLGDVAERGEQRAIAEKPEKRYLTVREAADYVGLSVSMLNRWRCDLPGGPPYIKVGSRVLYALEDLDQLLHLRRQEPRR